MVSSRREPLILLLLTLVGLVVSGWQPETLRQIWVMETLPVMIGVVLLTLTWNIFPLTDLAYRLMVIFGIVMLIGGHYSYAEVPLFNWLRDTWELSRNHFDRVGHFLQGFVPAILAREVLLRRSPLPRGKWLFFLVVCFCLALSAFYEFIEWWAALLIGETAEIFLATQGDPWDTQMDMFLAFTGSILAQLLLARRHDHELRKYNLE